MAYDRLNRLIVLAVLFSLGHHIDHIIRGNHVGWPLIPEVTPFTISLGFYPVIAVAYYFFFRERRVGAGFWAVLAASGVAFVGLAHFGPLAVEPPADIIEPYGSPLVGWAALIWLVLLLVVLAPLALYAGYVWWMQQRRY